MKDKLSKEAREFLTNECKSSIDFWQLELKKTVKNKFIPSSAKIMVKAIKQNKINMFKEILEFIK